MRTLLSVLLIGVPVTLILTLIGLTTGYMDESRKRAAGIGADIRITGPGSNVLSFSNASIPDKIVDLLATEPHVAQAMGTVVAPIEGFDAAIGINPAAFNKMSGGFTFEAGNTFQNPNDILVDSWYADQRHVAAGGTLNLWQHDWHIAGVVEPGKLGHIFVQMKPLQDLQGGAGKVSQIFLKLDNAANVNGTVDYLRKKYDGYKIFSMAEWQSLISMYMAVLQRTREIGILKSLGARNSFVMGLILAEAFVMGLGGTIFGIVLSYGSQYAIHSVMPASLPQGIVYIG